MRDGGVGMVRNMSEICRYDAGSSARPVGEQMRTKARVQYQFSREPDNGKLVDGRDFIGRVGCGGVHTDIKLVSQCVSR